jgi:hypothetical protein
VSSDVDLIAVGSGPADRLLVCDGWQVSVSWRTVEEVRASFLRPADAGGAVPAWRGAWLLLDRGGVAGRLQAEAHAWEWSLIDEAADVWVAAQVTGYAEEVHRLVGQATDGSPRTAAVMRCLLAVHLGAVLAVHHRLLYDSENRLWDLVAQNEGYEWATAQDRALAVVPATTAQATGAALDLYATAAHRTAHLLDADQAVVVARALGVAGRAR